MVTLSEERQPDQLDYLDLLPRRGSRATALPILGVAEHQGTALLYLVDASDSGNPVQPNIEILQKQLANRSDPAWIGLIQPGTLVIYPIGFHANADRPLRILHESDQDAPLFFQSLVHGTFSERPEGIDYVYQRIFKLLENTIETFVPSPSELQKNAPNKPRAGVKTRQLLEPLDVLSLAGRALFFRFLIDRRIVVPDERTEICPSGDDLMDAFSSASSAAETSSWLDETFNGNFLRLIDENIPPEERAARKKAYELFYEKIDASTGGLIFRHLEAILRGWKSVDRHAFQTELDWGDLDFAHIPIGVLSQVYESFSHRADPELARQTSVHYTPRTIARIVVDETFAALENPATATILDPACGAGIFLAMAFRRLVRERWVSDNQRPTASTIRQILYRQLRGFDISESALRPAALTLYITAIEVNGSPRPPKTLKFPRDLRNEVLFHFGGNTLNCSRFPLGSLSSQVAEQFGKQFDIVISNPPWTRLREDERQRAPKPKTKTKVSASAPSAALHALPKKGGKLSSSDMTNALFTEVGQSALREKGLVKSASEYRNPDKNPDLPFFWRATQWAKKDGLIAMVLPARIFQRLSGPGSYAWQTMLESVSVTGLLNGADLRKTPVWEGIDVPFCLFFARNDLPAAGHAFHYATPHYEPGLNRYGRFRIDYEAAQPVTVERVKSQPWLLKTLALGTWLDVEVMEQILAAFPKTLANIWGDEKATGQGYNISAGLTQNPDEFLADMKDFERPETGFSISHDKLFTFEERHQRRTAHMPRREELYRPPLVIIPQAPGENADCPRAYLSSRPLAFSQSFYGYSCAWHPHGKALASLLYLLPHSALFSYFCLMTSVRAGSDRQTFNKGELDALPFPDVSSLSDRLREEICTLARRLQRDVVKPWREINSIVFSLYGLDEDAEQTIRDTLFASVQYREQGRDALKIPLSSQDCKIFGAELIEMLDPYFDVCGSRVVVEEPTVERRAEHAWRFLAIRRASATLDVDEQILREAMAEANRRAASRIIIRAPSQAGLLLGILNQRRWWTRTRARLCAQFILRHHLDAFGLTEDA